MRRRRDVWRGGLVLCLGMLLLLGACDNATTAAPAQTPTGTSVGVQPVNAANWGGYVAQPGNVTGVSARWTEPQLSGNPDTLAAIWVGIGGWGTTYNEGVQVGVRAWLKPDGTTEHRVWYETLPASSWTLTDLTVAAGDGIAASITEASTGSDQWQLRLADDTSGGTFTQTVTHHSARVYADFIVEDPDATATNGPPYYPLVHFTPITFTTAQACYGGTCAAIGDQPLLQVSMVQGNAVVVQPGPLSNGSFTVQRGG